MSIHSRFLTLSIKEQVCLTIFLLTVFSVLVILCLPCSFSYEILREDYKKKKRFFYNEYKEYIEACFYYQGYNLLKYEEIIKRMLKEADKYSTRGGLFDYKTDFKEEYNDQFPVRDLFYNESKEDENRTDILYFYCFNEDKDRCKEVKESLKNKYESLYSLIFTTDVYNRFRLPELDIPIVDKAIAVNINESFMFCFDKKVMMDNLELDFNKIASDTIDYVSRTLEDYVNDEYFLYNNLYQKAEQEVFTYGINYRLDETLTPEERKEIIREFAKEIVGYHSSVQFTNDKSRVLSYDYYGDQIYYYIEMYMEAEFLLLVHQALSIDLNIHFVPLFSHNNTILLPDICVFFMMRQTHDIFKDEKLYELYDKIIRGNSTIKECFYDKDYYEKQKIITEIFDEVGSPFLDITNKINQGIYKLPNGEPLYFMKYSFPNFNLLKNFKSDHLIMDPLNFYLFSSFKEPEEFADYIWAQHKNLFYLIIILIVYIWVICFLINMLIFYKVIKQITEPIYKLQEAIEANNVKDENVFKYEYDDIINELFITCKELITRQIDTRNNTKYSKQFNILNSGNDKNNVIDKSKYEKNLIINNDIMNELINEQQNMNDLSENIDTNTELDEDLVDKEEKHGNLEKEENKQKDDKNINDNNDKFKNIVNQNKIEEENDKESYKSLFRLAEYLYYYRCKNEDNIITVNAAITDESKKSNKMKMNKVKKKISKIQSIYEVEENISINMFKDKDITYLWYMEMKKRKNKSFNYQVSDDYEELFMDFNT